MSLPIIGITPLWDEEKDSLWMLPGYMDGVRNSGGLPIMLPLTSDKDLIKQICRMVDGLLFTGGHDIFPGMYGCETNECCGPICCLTPLLVLAVISVRTSSRANPVRHAYLL